MSNLVPLHIDKDTGRIVATGTPAINTGGGSASGFEFIIGVASTVWHIEHNANLTTLLCQAYDDIGELIMPEAIKITDSNIVDIFFNAPITGTAHLIFFTV